MERYQLRLSAGQSLGDVLSELLEEVWRVLRAHPEFAGLGAGDRAALRAGLSKVLESFVVRYDTCGLEALCEESLEPAEWNRDPDPNLGPRHPWQAEEVKRLALEVERSLESFVDALEAAIFREVFAMPETAPLAKGLRGELGGAIRGVLGPHLYRSVSCGLLELCRQARKLNPWK